MFLVKFWIFHFNQQCAYAMLGEVMRARLRALMIIRVHPIKHRVASQVLCSRSAIQGHGSWIDVDDDTVVMNDNRIGRLLNHGAIARFALLQPILRVFTLGYVGQASNQCARLPLCIVHDGELIQQPAILTVFMPETVFYLVGCVGRPRQRLSDHVFDAWHIVGMGQMEYRFQRQGFHLVRRIAGHPGEIGRAHV